MNQVFFKTLFFCSFFPFNFPALLSCDLPCPRFLLFSRRFGESLNGVGDPGEDTEW